MDLINNLALGFGVAFTLQNLLYAFVGALLGTLIGVLPGLGPVATIAMLLPSIYALDATPALIMLAGIYYGAQYGGSTTAILINVPGESQLGGDRDRRLPDGAQGPRRRRRWPPPAWARSSPAAWARIIIAAFAPPLTELAFKFGPAEYFSLMVLGLIGAVVLASGSLVKAIAMILLGLLLGPDQHRRHLRRAALQLRHPRAHRRHRLRRHRDGRVRLRRDHRQPRPAGRAPRGLHQGRQGPVADQAGLQGRLAGGAARHRAGLDAGRAARRRRAAGVVCGLHAGEEDRQASPATCPSARATSAAWPAPRAANNAGAQTSFIPMLTLGIPPNAVMALMVGAMTIKGIQPGPQVMTSNPELFWGLIAVDVGRQRDAGRS